MPPDTSMRWALIQRSSSETSEAIIAPMSSGTPARPSAVIMPMAGPILVNNSDAYNTACLAGLGLMQAPELGVREHLSRGELVEVLPNNRPEPMSAWLLYAHRRNLPRRVRIFMDWAADVLRPVFSGER